MNWAESAEAIQGVDELLASVGLEHGSRKTLGGTWKEGERVKRVERPAVASKARRETRRSVAKLELMQAPGWEKYKWLRHGFSTRAGGVTTAYDFGGGASLNLGWTKEDTPENVVENRRRFVAAVTGGDLPLVNLRQIHSGLIRAVDETGAAGMMAADGKPTLRGDGLMTDAAGVLLGVGVADCVPVLVADVRTRVVAAFHAGWRGTLGRIVERGVGKMRLEYGSRPEDLIAAIGPSIGPCCYAVGEDLRHEFESQFAYAPELFSEWSDSDPVKDKYPLLFLTARAPGHSNIGPQIHLDLWEANRRQLIDAGLKPARIWVAGECTACTGVGTSEGRRYFSHRGESGFAGRGLGVIGVVDAS